MSASVSAYIIWEKVSSSRECQTSLTIWSQVAHRCLACKEVFVGQFVGVSDSSENKGYSVFKGTLFETRIRIRM